MFKFQEYNYLLSLTPWAFQQQYVCCWIGRKVVPRQLLQLSTLLLLPLIIILLLHPPCPSLMRGSLSANARRSIQSRGWDLPVNSVQSRRSRALLQLQILIILNMMAFTLTLTTLVIIMTAHQKSGGKYAPNTHQRQIGVVHFQYHVTYETEKNTGLESYFLLHLF